MSSVNTQVTAEVRAKVTGTRDVAELAESLTDVEESAQKTDRLQVGAKVTGEKDVTDLGKALANLDDVDVAVDADVTGDRDVADLGRLVDGLPDSTDVEVDAEVSGDKDVVDLGRLVDGLPASTDLDVDAKVSGDRDVADLHTSLDELDDVDVKVRAEVTGDQGVSDLSGSLDDVESSAGNAGSGLSGLSSEITGTLGGSFSDGAGMVADFGEQFRNLRDAVDEAGGIKGGGGLAALGAIAGGIGGTIIGGMLIDQVLGMFAQLEEAQQRVKDAVTDVTDALVENGGQWNQAAAQAQLAAVEGSDVFQALLEAGVSYGDAMDVMLDKTGQGVEKASKLLEGTGIGLQGGGIREIEGFNNVAAAAEGAAAAKLDYLEKNDLLTESQEEGLAAAEASRRAANLNRDAYRAAGDAADEAAGDVRELNNTPMKDKDADLTMDDKASPKVDAVNKKKLGDKSADLIAHDKFLAKVDAANRASLHDKDADLTADDKATPKIDALNRKQVGDKTTTVDANTDPAKRDIDALNGRDVTVNVSGTFGGKLRDMLFGTASASVSVSSSRAAVPDDVDDAAARGLEAESEVMVVPSLGRSVMRTAVAPSTPTVVQHITINGAVDAAGTARQIQQLETRAQRRTGPVRVGGRFRQVAQL